MAIRVAALCLLMPATLVQAQAPPAAPTPKAPAPDTQAQKPAQGPKIITLTETVVVPVTVKDKAGNLVADLHKDEFRVFEDNVEQLINLFKLEPTPLSLIVLIDNDLRRKDALQVDESLPALVGGLSLNDEAFICSFDQFFHEGKGFTADQDKLMTQLSRTKLASQPSAPPPGDPFNGPTINNQPAPGVPYNPGSARAIASQSSKALDDAVYEAALLLRDRGRDRRKIIILISDGQNGVNANTHPYKSTVEELLRYNISVYSIATGYAYLDRKFSRLVDYAHDTGGDVYFGAKASTYSELYSKVGEEARNQYTLGYSPHGTDRGADYHSIEVRVKRDGLTLLAREGYYSGAAPPSR